MSNNTQHRIQVTLNQNSINHAKPNITSHSSHSSSHIVIINNLWFSAASHPTTTSSFLEQMVRCVLLLNAVRLSPLSLKELWVKTSMHRTSGTILATSRNKEKHLSPPHCFTQVRGYNTRTNPLPLLHTGERVFTGFLGTENLTQHLISSSILNKANTPIMEPMKITYCQPNIHHHLMLEK